MHRIVQRIAMIALVLCFCATFLSPSAFLLPDANHTHVCGDETHHVPEDCIDAHACCIICTTYYNFKAPDTAPTSTCALPVPATPPASLSLSEDAPLCASFATLTSLKIRLNN